MQNADDARNGNEEIHIYGTKFCPWLITRGGQGDCLGASPLRNLTPGVVLPAVSETSFQARREKEVGNTR